MAIVGGNKNENINSIEESSLSIYRGLQVRILRDIKTFSLNFTEQLVLEYRA